MSAPHRLDTVHYGKQISDVRSAVMEQSGHNYLYPDPEKRAVMPRWNESETEQEFPMQESVPERNSPLNQALDRSHATFDELAMVISELVDRLEQITAPANPPKPEMAKSDGVKEAERVPSSTLVKRLRLMDSNIERETRRIHLLLENLDI